jgi:8-oxo-dGTP pyrophosphatase MutT (NUDIX family)
VHREPLLNALSEYAARHPGERACSERFAAFVRAHPDCFSRTLVPGHVTGSAWVVHPDGAQVLLTHHRKLDMWVQLGGHADDDPDPARVALREAEEESGLVGLELVSPGIFDIDIHRIPARGSEPEHEHFDVRFAIRATSGTVYRVSPESKALAWVPVAGVARLTSEPSMLRMCAKWLALRDAGRCAGA